MEIIIKIIIINSLLSSNGDYYKDYLSILFSMIIIINSL